MNLIRALFGVDTNLSLCNNPGIVQALFGVDNLIAALCNNKPCRTRISMLCRIVCLGSLLAVCF